MNMRLPREHEINQEWHEADCQCDINKLAGTGGEQFGEAGGLLHLHRNGFLAFALGYQQARAVLDLFCLRLQLLEIVVNHCREAGKLVQEIDGPAVEEKCEGERKSDQ